MKKVLLSLAMFGAIAFGQDTSSLPFQQYGQSGQYGQYGQYGQQLQAGDLVERGEMKDTIGGGALQAAGERELGRGAAPLGSYYQSVGIGGRGQFLSATPIGAQLQYSTSPILEQLREMSTSSFNPVGAIRRREPLAQTGMLSGVWDDAKLIEGQQQTYYDSMFQGQKPVPQSYIQPMLEASAMSQQAPPAAAVASMSAPFPAAKSVKPIKEFKYVNAPITSQYETLPVKELPNIVQMYAVPSTFTTQENIKQPITQPVWQPYLQRYEQRAVPVVQPVVNRVVQPIIHRQLHPYLTSETIQGPQQDAIVNPPKVLEFKNEVVVGSEMNALPLEDRSKKPNVPTVAPATAQKKHHTR